MAIVLSDSTEWHECSSYCVNLHEKFRT